jgi:hypothetical protein
MSNAIISNTSVRMVTLLGGGIGAVETVSSVLNLRGGNGVGLCHPPVSSFSDGFDWRFVSIPSLFKQTFEFKQQLERDRANGVGQGKAGGTNAELLYHC